MVAHRTLTRLAALCALTLGVTLACKSAQAAVIHKYLSQITEVPAGPGVTAPGSLYGANSMAIDSGIVYLAEQQAYPAPERLDEFDAASGSFVRQFALPSSLTAFYFFGLAASHATGEEQVYAGAEDSEANDHLVVFDGEGNELGEPWSGSDTPSGSFGPYLTIGGVAADGRSVGLGWPDGDVYVSDRTHKVVDVFEPSSGGKEKYVTRIEGPEAGVPFLEPSLVAVNQSNGDVVVVDKNSVVDVFEPTVLNEYVLIHQITGTPAGPFRNIENFYGKGLAVDSNGDIYVAENGTTEGPVVYQFSSTGEYLGRLTGTPSGGFHAVNGLAVDPGTHKVYVGDEANQGTEEPGAVDVFAAGLTVPDVTTGSAFGIGPSGATVSGTVDPRNAGVASCQVVWGVTPAFGHTTPCPASIPNGAGAVSVQVALPGLSSDTTYYYRLQASNSNGSNLGEAYEDREFHTLGPAVHQQWVVGVTSSSVTLDAKIDPNGSGTTYYFQYGTSSGYGTDVPAAPGAALGSASGDVVVSQHMQGLSPSTVYHYRVVAVSELPGGEIVQSEGPDQTFTTQPASSGSRLPDGRAWEMVSPPDKHGSALEPAMQEQPNGSVVQAAVDGGAVTYIANGPVEDRPQGNRAPEWTQLLSTRTSNGWKTATVTTAFSEAGNVSVGFGFEYRAFSSDLTTGLLSLQVDTSLSSEATERTPYLRHDSTCEESPATCYEPLVTAANVEPSSTKFGSVRVEPVTATPDLNHVVLYSEVPLTEEGVLQPGEAPFYEWSAGKLKRVDILPDGLAPTEGGVQIGAEGQVLRHAISNDGSRIVFFAGGHLYSRDMVTGHTVQADATESGAQGGQGTPVFQAASSNGAKIFFLDSARLTVDSTSAPGKSPEVEDLYEFDVETGRVTDLTVDAVPGEHANVQGAVQGVSEDGSYVYFVANGVLAPGASPGNCGDPSLVADKACNLYVRHAGATTYIATLSGDDQNWVDQTVLEIVSARVSPDGKWFAFMSNGNLTGYDNRDANSGAPDEEVFLYSADSGRLSCVSCNPTGARPVGMFEPEGVFPGPLVDRSRVWLNKWFAATIPGWTKVTGSRYQYQSRYLSNSGRLFFNSNVGLVPQDVNGTTDVYEFEPETTVDCARDGSTFVESADGCVGLISSGGSADESVFMDASESGDEAFFLTSAKLRPEDFDNALDMYDARVCTSSSPCQAIPPASPPVCSTGDSCKPAPSSQPSVFGAAPSATFSGIGNIITGSTPSVGQRSLTRAQRLARALKTCRRMRDKHKRALCTRRAHRRYARKATTKHSITLRVSGNATTSGR